MRLIYKAGNLKNQASLDSLTTFNNFKDYKTLKKSNDSTINELYQKGYINLLTQPLKKINENTYTQLIILNKKYNTIELIANPLNTEIDSLIEIALSRKRNQNYIPISDIEKKLNEIHSFIINKGFSFLKIESQPYQPKKGDTLTLYINLSVEGKRKINKIKIKGYEDFPRKYLNRINRQQLLLNNKNLDNITTDIKKIPFIKITKEPEILFKKDSTIVYIYLERKNNNTADGLIGFNNSVNGKLELNGYIDLSLHNNLNKGEKLTILYRGENEDQTRLDIQTEYPYLFKTNIGVTASLNLLRRDSTYQNSTITTGLFYTINPLTNLGLSYKKNESIVNEISQTSNNFTSDNIFLGISHQKPSNEDIFTNDFMASIQIGVGNRTLENNTSRQTFINSTVHQNIYIDPKQSIHLENHIKYIGSKNILFNELFQIGGNNSIRGFNQNSIDTSFFTSINTEYRYRIANGIYLHSIVDYAVFEDYNTKQTQNLYGIGFGTAILTQSGILRLSVANGSFSGANMDFSSTVAHINLQIKF